MSPVDLSELSRALEAALEDSDAASLLRAVILDFKGRGLSKDDAYSTLAACADRHRNDSDETKYDALLDVMDLVVGWCGPHARLYD